MGVALCNKLLIIDTTTPGFAGALSGPGFLFCEWNPSEFNDEKGVNWVECKTPGSSHPRVQFGSGEVRIIRFKIPFTFIYDPSQVRRSCNWLLSLEYPTHAGTVLDRPPAVCMLIFGALYRAQRVVFKSVKVRYYEMFERWSLYPMRAEVECVCWEYSDRSIDVGQIRSLI